MNRQRFFSLFIILVILFLFLKVYQHNKIFNLMREKQRIEREKEKLLKEKDTLLVESFESKNQNLMCSRARKELGMVDLKPEQIRVLHERKL